MNLASMTAQVLQVIRRACRPLSKTDIASATGLSLSAVSEHVERLTSEKLILGASVGMSSGGRKPKLYTLNEKAGWIVAVELGTASVRVGISDFDCKILDYKSTPMVMNEGPKKTLTRVHELVEGMLDANGIEKRNVMGIGIGFPGPVEFATGLPVSPPIMPGWDQYPIREFWAQYFDCPCYVDNDVNIMAVGEHAKGLNFQVDNLIYIKIGTGIGAGIIVDGKLYRGINGSAGDIGHIDVGLKVDCWCGNRGCLEALAGGKAIAARAKQLAQEGKSDFLRDRLKLQGDLTAKDVGLGLQSLDSASIELIRESGDTIGRVLASLVNFTNPSLVLIGGGVAELGDILLASIRQGVYRRSLPLATRNLAINQSSLGKMAGLIGGAYMTIDQLISSRIDAPETAIIKS
ncbi:ROK family transcriptional regulator [Cohnella kolymensis]|uniref:ROK family transcriptional regulator n=1 Tax=Cohnella kolymensis TaxID=1590652 RepID=UPI000695DF0D|nr:ROK family transcriptional regulator [Cohnella kolymensis]